MNIILDNIYKPKIFSTPYYITKFYELLKERTFDESISHKGMPSLEDHETFVLKEPYISWSAIIDEDTVVGSIYITPCWELGIFIFKVHRKLGYATQAIAMTLDQYPHVKFLANINPNNQKSINLFKKFGFGHIQNTYQRA